MKKVVFDARMINSSGIGRYIKELLNVLNGSDYSVYILCKGNVFGTEKLFPRFKYISFDYPIYSVIEQLKFIFKVPKCDLFISPHYNIPVFLPTAKKMLVIIPDVNHLVFIKGFSFIKRLYARTMFFFVGKKSDLIITISDFSKSEIVKYINYKRDNIIVAKLSIDRQYFESIQHSSVKTIDSIDNPFFLFVGNVKPHKNLKRTILAFKEIVNEFPEFRFVIVGKSENMIHIDGELFRFIQDDPLLCQTVYFTGAISDKELICFYKNAYSLIFVSLYEGFGIPPLEAMYFGCPVIASQEGSLPEICGDAALYADAYDVNDIKNKMELIIKDNMYRDSMIRKGKEKLKEYDWSVFDQILQKNIKDLLN